MVSSWRLSFFSRKKICSQPIKGLERGVATFYDLPGIPSASPSTLLVCNDRRLPSFHYGDRGVGGAQIDTDDLSHVLNNLLYVRFPITAVEASIGINRAASLAIAHPLRLLPISARCILS
jgi:hypothetical protein